MSSAKSYSSGQLEPNICFRYPPRRTYSVAGWALSLGYVIDSPSLNILGLSSQPRAVLVTLIVLFAGGLCLRIRAPVAGREGGESARPDLVLGACICVVVWQAMAATVDLGAGEFVRLAPAVAVLLLAFVARRRGQLRSDCLPDAVAALLPPFTVMLTIGAALQYMGFIGSEFSSTFVFSVGGSRLQGFAVHPVSLGVLAALLLVISMYASPSRTVWASRLVFLVNLIGSNSRTALVGAAVSFVVIIVLAKGWSARRRMLYAGALTALTPLLLDAVSAVRETGGSNLSGRDLIWQNALRIIDRVPWTGYGPGAVSRLFPTVGGPGSRISQAQNQWLNDWINFGLLGMVTSALVIVALVVVGCWSIRRSITIPLVAGVVAISFSEIPINLWSGLVQAVPLALIILVAPRPRPVDARPVDQRPRRVAAS